MISYNGNTLANESLNISEVSSLFSVTKRESESARSCSSCTTDTVYIGLRFVREVIVDYKFEFINVDSTSSNIGSYEYTNIPIFEPAECSLPGVL